MVRVSKLGICVAPCHITHSSRGLSRQVCLPLPVHSLHSSDRCWKRRKARPDAI